MWDACYVRTRKLLYELLFVRYPLYSVLISVRVSQYDCTVEAPLIHDHSHLLGTPEFNCTIHRKIHWYTVSLVLLMKSADNFAHPHVECSSHNLQAAEPLIGWNLRSVLAGHNLHDFVASTALQRSLHKHGCHLVHLHTCHLNHSQQYTAQCGKRSTRDLNPGLQGLPHHVCLPPFFHPQKHLAGLINVGSNVDLVLQGVTHQVAGDVLAGIGRPPKKGVFLAHNEVAHFSGRLVAEASRSAHIKILRTHIKLMLAGWKCRW